MSASREATNGIGQPVRRKEDFRLLIAKVCFSSNSDRMADIRAGPPRANTGSRSCSRTDDFGVAQTRLRSRGRESADREVARHQQDRR